MKVKRATNWSSEQVTLFSADGAVRHLSARRAGYEIPGPGVDTFYPGIHGVVAFHDTVSGMTYVGHGSDFYIETGTALVGLDASGSAVIWRDSFVSNLSTEERLEATIARFESKVGGKEWIEKTTSTKSTIYLTQIFGPDFTAASPGSAGPGSVSLNKFNVRDGKVELHLKNQTGELDGILWIEIATRKIVRAALNGEEAFPNRHPSASKWREWGKDLKPEDLKR